MPEIRPYHQSPEAVRDVLRMLNLLKRERTSGISPSDELDLQALRLELAQIDGGEMIELVLNNATTLARCLKT